MNGTDILLDSNIIIYISQGKIPVDRLVNSECRYYISAVTYMEVLGYNFDSDAEEEVVKNLLDFFTIIYIDERIMHKVIDIRKRYKLKLPDAIICATAMINNFILYTGDRGFINISELQVEFIKV